MATPETLLQPASRAAALARLDALAASVHEAVAAAHDVHDARAERGGLPFSI